MTVMTSVWLVLGLIILIVGAEFLVRGASRLAGTMGISPLVIGLTVVAFGTSAPELAVSVVSSLSGQGDIALGNVIGSNIANILLILGVSAAIVPLAVQRQLIRFDLPIMVITSLLMLIFAWNGNISRVEGLILFTGVLCYTAYLVVRSRREKKEVSVVEKIEVAEIPSVSNIIQNLLLALMGLGMLLLGSRLLVDSAVTIATAFGVSELLIGLTIVAVGTSLPEIATSIVAAMRGERDIAVGNAIGSNIFNILSVLGMTALLSGGGVNVPAAALKFDIPIMIAVALLCLPIFYSRMGISRWEGILFLFYYIIYTVYLIFSAESSVTMAVFAPVMLVVITITLVMVLVDALRDRMYSARFL